MDRIFILRPSLFIITRLHSLVSFVLSSPFDYKLLPLLLYLLSLLIHQPLDFVAPLRRSLKYRSKGILKLFSVGLIEYAASFARILNWHQPFLRDFMLLHSFFNRIAKPTIESLLATVFVSVIETSSEL